MGIIENGEIEEGSDDKIYKKLRLENGLCEELKNSITLFWDHSFFRTKCLGVQTLFGMLRI